MAEMAVSSSEAHLSPIQIKMRKIAHGEVEMTPIIVSSTGENNVHEADSSVTGVSHIFDAAFEATTSETNRRVTRFLQVVGYDGRANDLIYAPPVQTERLENGVESSTPDHDTSRVLVFFGGDIQDYPELMELQIDNREHKDWNLENTAIILSNQFPDRHVVVVRPSRMQFRTYTCFDHFLTSNHMSVPELTPFHGALLHLKALLRELSHLLEERRKEKAEKAAAAKAKAEESEPSRLTLTFRDSSTCSRPIKLDTGDISLVGFSKGCAVLNQFLYEFHYLKTLTPDDESYEELLGSLKDMYWLDGGHHGAKHTWVISRSVLETLSRMGTRIHVHVTPYQIADERRPVIRREEKQFSKSLRSFGAPIKRFIHSENLNPSLATHFQVLAEFGCPPTSDLFAEPEEEEFDVPDYFQHPSQSSHSEEDLNDIVPDE